MNEFNKQKQEIKKLIVKTFFNVAGLASKENKQELFDAVDNLQPPKLTCSTCDYWCINPFTGDKDCDRYYTISNCNEQSCVHHSDYGDKNE